jgi:hypothetical protein
VSRIERLQQTGTTQTDADHDMVTTVTISMARRGLVLSIFDIYRWDGESSWGGMGQSLERGAKKILNWEFSESER